jgi:hypothetical protein
VDVPIACTLTPDAADERVDEWRAALGQAAAAAGRVAPARLEIRLRPGARVAALVDLVRREVACCPFFRFTLEVDAGVFTLTVAVPPEAETVLDAFSHLVPPDAGNPELPGPRR